MRKTVAIFDPPGMSSKSSLVTALVATTRYMIMGLLGSGVFLIGIAMLYDLTGHLLMENLGAAVQALFQSGNALFPLTIIVGLFSVGMGIKSALFPFHTCFYR